MRRKDREISNISDIESVIKSCDVCRIAFANDNIPYIVTMNFGFSGGETPYIYFHGASSGRKFDMLRRNNYVCFEMDTDHELYGGETGCDWGMNFRSVVGYGYITIVEDPVERKKGLDHIMHHYTGRKDFRYDEKTMRGTCVLKLSVMEMTGKKR
ncbi:MAG TPA: pyridoxamine 5'-phosphate oxidase family protein [Bacteroidales bacterium]|nr:pyridoxamine 5'-phosphate oxidase family protein [Bacteroidales bacterium]